MADIKSDDPTEQKHFHYLEKLRQSGITNMYGAASYLQRIFPEDFGPSRSGETAAGEVLLKWMRAHGETRKLI